MKKLFLLLIGYILLASCGGDSVSDDNSATVITFDKQELTVDYQATGNFTITSNANWTINVPDAAKSWCSVKPQSGKGGKAAVKVTVTTTEDNPTKKTRSATLTIKADRANPEKIIISQTGSPNNAPSKPVLSVPGHGSTNISIYPQFTWKASTDADDDPVSYTLEYSSNEDFTVSDKISASTNTSAFPSKILSSNTKYYYRVQAYDGFGGISEWSNTFSFTTGNQSAYQDGEWVRYQTADIPGVNPVYLVFTGDGYIKEDFIKGTGDFDKHINEGIEALFSIEPYKTYRNYFTVYKIAAYSEERGMSGAGYGEVDTKFKVTLLQQGSTSLNCNTTAVTEWAKKITEIPSGAWSNIPISVTSNKNVYAGSCYVWNTGRSIAMAAVSRNSNERYSYAAGIHHELGGHGFGLLGDEYTSVADVGRDETTFKLEVSYGRHKNLDLTGDPTKVKWKHFFILQGYEAVSTYEGGYYHVSGFWRPEPSSCMTANYKYFNAPSREAIVQRIMSLSGGTYSLTEFINKDVVKSLSSSSSSTTQEMSRFIAAPFVPLGKPIMMD